MNPCPVFERNTRSLFLFFICVLGNTSECWQIITGRNKARLCYVTSSDHGQTWSQVEDVTNSTIGDTVSDWATFAVGPGHGLQLESGRLIIPTHAQYISRRCCSIPVPLTVKPYALAVYSDDSGKTWHMGEMLQGLSGECEMAEIIDRDGRHHVYCNARTMGGHRVEALSEAEGTSFDTPRLAHQLVETGKGCQGSVVGFPAPEPEAGSKGGTTTPSPGSLTWLLYSHPTDKSIRRDVGVYLNRTPQQESGWSLPWVIHSGPSAYSDMAYNEDGKSFACLLECGKDSELEQIAFVSFTLNDVIEHTNKKK